MPSGRRKFSVDSVMSSVFVLAVEWQNGSPLAQWQAKLVWRARSQALKMDTRVFFSYTLMPEEELPNPRTYVQLGTKIEGLPNV